jgi:hypothetical protein
MPPSTFNYRRSNRAAGKAPRLASGYRSGLEKRNADHLEAHGIPYSYETLKLSYEVPQRSATYTPDFVLANGIIVETKGVFDTEDRAKHLLVKAQHPELDIRFVFQRGNQPIYKGSPTTHGAWCDKHGFTWAEKLIPPSWAKEPKAT